MPRKRSKDEVINDLVKAMMKLTPVTACPAGQYEKWDLRELLRCLLEEFFELVKPSRSKN